MKRIWIKNLVQWIFYSWVGICSLLMFFSLLKNFLNQLPLCKMTEPLSRDASISKSLSTETSPHPESDIEDALKQLNESIRSAQSSKETVIEPALVTKQIKNSAMESNRCQHESQPYLPGDLLKLEKGWVRCSQVDRKSTWVEVK